MLKKITASILGKPNRRSRQHNRRGLLQTVIGSGLVLLSLSCFGISFNHPGGMNSLSDLEFMKAQVLANKQPWKSAYNSLVSSNYANANYEYTAFRTVECGSYNNPNVGCNEMVADAIAAYTLALRWYISGEDKYADRSIEIIDAWSQKYRENTNSNARLIVSWTAPWYVNAAEILRYTPGSGWTNTNTNNLNTLFNRFKDYIYYEDKPANNWMMSAVQARLAIAVFQNDSTAFNNAIERWKFRVKTYIYQTSDGAEPILPPAFTRARIRNVWKSGSTNLNYVNGLSMETCRDWNHTRLGVDSIIYAAEMAWTQGIDLFEEEEKRLIDFFELHANWLNGANVPNSICDGNIDWKGDRSSQRTAFEIAYGHLADRLGNNLPETQDMLNAKRPRSAARWVTTWETLGFANRDFGNSSSFAPNVWFNEPSYNPTVDEGYNLYVNVHADDPDGDISNVKLFINGNFVRQESVYPYEWGHDTSPDPDEVNKLAAGTYTFKAVATDNSGLSSESTFKLTVNNSNSGGDACQMYSGSSKQEIDLGASNCITFNAGLNGKTLQFWDSDTHTGCNFRGIVSSVDGSGSLTIDQNYKSISEFTGSTLKFSTTNSCPHIKVRAY
jgi:hypothetical protein